MMETPLILFLIVIQDMHDIRFDLCIGVLAGDTNVTAYVAEQYGRNLQL